MCPMSGIVIFDANYGRTDNTTCLRRPHRRHLNTNCTSPNTLDIVTKSCAGRHCILAASNDVFSDPCIGTRKYLKVVFGCAGYDR
ncbi:L-rhamnose-binding lectin CSL3 isoform X2 [Danio rerio]|uniref:L-rhamnose-binding lectin CSL3 isoform X2 n=2 Tax=Danio rerio TaxID=7955 RepID=A0AC58GFS7_DANRE